MVFSIWPEAIIDGTKEPIANTESKEMNHYSALMVVGSISDFSSGVRVPSGLRT